MITIDSKPLKSVRVINAIVITDENSEVSFWADGRDSAFEGNTVFRIETLPKEIADVLKAWITNKWP